MFSGGGGGGRAPMQPAGAAPPKDALEALMNGQTPDKRALEFRSDNSGPLGTGGGSSGRRAEDAYGGGYGSSSGGYGSSGGKQSSSYGYPPSGTSAHDDYGQPKKQQAGALDSVKQGAAKSGAFVKDRTVAGATYLKEKDWSKEKEMAGKAGQATKTGAIYVGSNVAKGANWLWKSGKSGVDSLRGSGSKPGEPSPRK